VVSKEWAVQVVQRHLAERVDYGGPAMVVANVEPHRLGWTIGIQSERYLQTGRFEDAAVGQGVFLVDGVDGSLHEVHATADLENGGWIEEYLEQVRGIERPDPLRSAVAEALGRGRRIEAIQVVRSAAPDLSLSGAVEYMQAVWEGSPVPDHVRAQLPQRPAERVVRLTLSGPNPEPSA
jgi:hypothetical protein